MTIAPTLSGTATATGITPATATGTAGHPSASAQSAKLKSAAQAFEAVFLRQMISSMRQAGLGDGMMDSQATAQFQDMADSKTADAMSHKGVLGIAEMLSNQLSPAIPQLAAAKAGIAVAGRAAHVVGDLASRIKL